jgi:hypothetical protein
MSSEAFLILGDSSVVDGRFLNVGATFRSPAGGLKASPTSRGSDMGYLDDH